jgi:signal transduction histidine kinase
MRLSIYLFIIGLSLISIAQEIDRIVKIKTQVANAGDSLKVHLYTDLCYEYRFISQDSAIMYGRKAISLAKSINYQNGIAQGSNDLGIIYADKMDSETALNLYDDALKIWSKAGDSLRIAAVFNKKGIVFQTLGKLDSAMAYQFKCLNIYEAMNNDHGTSYALNNIAIIFNNQGDHRNALKYHQRALMLRRKNGDRPGTAASLVNIGNIYLDRGLYDSAILFYKPALPTLKSLNAVSYLGSTYNNLANAYLKLEEVDSAKIYLKASIAIREQINDVKGLVSNYHALANLYFAQNQFIESEIQLKKALALAESLGINSSLAEIHDLLMRVAEKSQDYKSALHHALMHQQFKDSVRNEHAQATIAELQTKYETEKKEQQIALQESQLAEQKLVNQRNKVMLAGAGALIILLIVIGVQAQSRLKWKNRQLLEEQKRLAREAEMNAVISSQEKERNRFARDLHDGFGQLISTLNLNLKNLEAPKNKDERERVFNASAAVLEEMYQELKNICFDLMPQTLIKHGLEPALNEFANRLMVAGQHRIEVNVFALNERLTDLQEISLYRITQEWVNNVIKYSDAQKIVIQITKDEAEITLLIEDDGMGFDKSALTEGKGNGWRNMTSRSNLIQGELELDTNPGMKGNTLILNAIFNATDQMDALKMENSSSDKVVA